MAKGTDKSSRHGLPWRSVATNALVAGAGIGTGYLAGGALAHQLGESRPFLRYLEGMPPARRSQALKNSRLAIATLGGAAGLGFAALGQERIRQELKRLSRSRNDAGGGTKTASLLLSYELGLMRELG